MLLYVKLNLLIDLIKKFWKNVRKILVNNIFSLTKQEVRENGMRKLPPFGTYIPNQKHKFS